MYNQPRLEDGYNVAFAHGYMVWVDAFIVNKIRPKKRNFLGRIF